MKNIFLLCMPAVAFVFVLLNTTGLAQSEQTGDSAAERDYEEVFSAGDTNGTVYIDWQAPQATNEFFGPAWFLGAYTYVSNGLCIDLNRKILTDNLCYAINCSVKGKAALYLNLRDTNGVVLIGSDNLFALTNAIRYADGTNVVLFLNLPISQYPDAAIIQTVGRHIMAAASDAPAIVVHESLLFTDTAFELWSSSGQNNGSTNYSGAGSLGNFYDWVNSSSNSNNSSTNSSGSNTNSTSGNDVPGGDDQKGVIYVDQLVGNDTFSGRAPAVSVNKGPKKTVHGGLSIVGTNDTIIIRSGTYNENLNIIGKDVKVVIEGNVRL